MTQKIGFIGAGNMASAIIEAILKKNIANASDMTVCDISEEKCSKFKDMGLNIAKDINELALTSDIIFLAVKPQDYEKILNDLKKNVNEEKILVSIAAGISTSYIKEKIGFDCKVVRAMPNTPLLLSQGATALCHCVPITDDEFNTVKAIFEAGGVAVVLPESKMNAVISVNGSSPAYVYLIAKAVIDGAVKQGIDEETAKLLFCQSLIGSAEMILKSGKSPEELIKMVASPGGTTLKALEALYEHNVEAAIIDAMERCTKRAQELGK
jgi:pyrroline-5-carboxylate reductase